VFSRYSAGFSVMLVGSDEQQMAGVVVVDAMRRENVDVGNEQENGVTEEWQA